MTSRKESPLYSIALSLVAAAACHAEDWPGWRGPGGDGVCADGSYPVSWSASENVAWKAPLPGVGHSSPIVSGDLVILTAFDDAELTRLLVAYNRHTGEEAWRTAVGRSPSEAMHPKNSSASSTPVTDGDIVVATFVVDDNFMVVGVGIDGSPRWERSMSRFASRHGLHSCPVLDDGAVLVAGLQDSADSFVAKLDAQTGETLWLTQTETEIRSFSPPHVTRLGGGKTIVVSGADCTSAFDDTDGALLWRINGPAEKTVSSIVEDGERLYVAGGRDGRLLAVRIDADRQPVVEWTSSVGIPYVPSPILAGDLLHVVSDRGVYTQLDTRTGERRRRARLLGPTSASPVVAAGRLYLTDESGKTAVAELKPTFRVIAENEVGEPVMASLAMSDGAIFLRGSDNLFCIRGDE